MPLNFRNFFVIALSTYFGVLFIVVVVSMLSGANTLAAIGNVLLYFGIAILVLSFIFISATNRGSGATNSPRIRSDIQFKAWRKREQPLEFVAWAVILASVLIIITGYLMIWAITRGA